MDLHEINFWRRLEMFVKEVQVNDLPGEEEKEMILNVCKKQIDNAPEFPKIKIKTL